MQLNAIHLCHLNMQRKNTHSIAILCKKISLTLTQNFPHSNKTITSVYEASKLSMIHIKFPYKKTIHDDCHLHNMFATCHFNMQPLCYRSNSMPCQVTMTLRDARNAIPT